MIISPPFLPLKDTPVYSEEDVRTLMPNAAPGNGFFPVSQAMAWHGGMHFTATSAEEAVRAIADGVVVFRRDAELVRYNAQDHSTGCVVLRHTTEIGAQGDTATEVVFYSIYQHLRTLDKDLPAVGQPVYRKDKLGLAGFIHGIANRIHLEIVAGDADVQKLLGRSTGDLDLTHDGRSDAVYGQIYVLLPAQSPCYPSDPRTANNPAPSGNSGAEQLVIGIQYAQGQAALTTYKLTGEVQGTAVLEKDAEYNLYVEATERHNKLRANLQTRQSTNAAQAQAGSNASQPPLPSDLPPLRNAGLAGQTPNVTEIPSASLREAQIRWDSLPDSSPSGWYELLRFGRNLGPDPLPSNAAHWRQASLPGQAGAVWVDLNAAGTQKFSDADFPHWMGWKLVDDDGEDGNNQCNSALIDAMLSPPAQAQTAPSLTGPTSAAPETAQTTPAQKAANRLRSLADTDIQQQLAKTICKFPTEWADAEVRTRWAWIREQGNPYVPYPLQDESDFTEMSDFAQKLCFWEKLPEEDKNRLTQKHWHLNPVEFIVHFRRCGWLNNEELSKLIPRISYKYSPPTFKPATINISWSISAQRFSLHSINLNKTIRKYGMNQATRLSHFLGQTYIETDFLKTMSEYGKGNKNKNDIWPAPAMEFYTVFYGRGMMQLTWPSNYSGYGFFRSINSLPHVTSDYIDERITNQSEHYWSNPNDGGKKLKWHPRYDPDLISKDSFNACDSAGWYWVSKNIGNQETNINKVCDRGVNISAIGRVSVLVNGGSFGYFERQSYSIFIMNYLGDNIPRDDEYQEIISNGKNRVTVLTNFKPQRA